MSASGPRLQRIAETLRPAPNDRLEIRDDPRKGRGIFARVPITPGTIIENAPVILISPEHCALLDRTILRDYYFRWEGDPDSNGTGAVALGLVSLCNHSHRPCARVRRNLAQTTLDLIALTPIAPGGEVTIDYNCALWFEPQD